MGDSDNAPLLDNVESQSAFTESRQADCDESQVSRFSGTTWNVFGATIHYLVQTLVGACVCVTMWFAFKTVPVNAYQLHIGLSVIGYQLLMAHGIICLRSSGWSFLSVKHRRRVHWILQLLGSVIAIAGSAVMINEKSIHFNTVHGKLALAALIFTCASLINGLTSLYSVELRRFIPWKLSKISHIILGTAAFALSSACLVFGYNKNSFKKWASEEFAYVLIGVVITYTAVVIIAPCYFVLRRICCTEFKLF
ncbi:uncharacterized protein LOC126373037 [Pectinophora gossypiella]|uniref:uncharacterized protein LOC126373037 n=1 Tax=Pectinophora gossypiella TaxID=13191 RepID=UPI00214DF973|nr:uncharacterized protein LOC126373037 [Pectinophora gossypiella]